uniref:Uncharacterized protein n=1 Tax=Arundo donax TaxID=35708 RepID=A0A0A9GY31_ARUDO
MITSTQTKNLNHIAARVHLCIIGGAIQENVKVLWMCKPDEGRRQSGATFHDKAIHIHIFSLFSSSILMH